MPGKKDHSIRELSRLKITLRSDLAFMPQRAGDEVYYVVEDPVSSQFHRVGLAEYVFISSLDGRRSVGDVLTDIATSTPDRALTEQEAASICKWLMEAELAFTPESSQPSQLINRARHADRGRAWQRWNPVMFRVPLFRPDRFFEAVTPWLGWMHTRAAFGTWIVVCIIGAYRVIADGQRFAAASDGILAPGNWLWLLSTWIALKIVHEMSHGVVCSRYGGRVREAGLLLILFAPIAYVDVTSSWKFRSRWQRIHVAAAGMYIEILIAAAAAIIWSATEPGLLNNACHNAVVMAGLTTIVVNANPLMRFDGYYLFSDLLAIPNLYGDSQQFLSYLFRRYVLGTRATGPCWSRSHRVILPLYGAASLAWRVLVSACIVIAASTLLRGAGIVLAVVAGTLWLGKPAMHAIRYLLDGNAGEKPPWPRVMAVAGTVGILMPVGLVTLPWPCGSRAPAVVEYAPLTPVRARSSGFVREIAVESGERVTEGQVLARLSNDELQLEAAQVKIDMEESRLRCRMFKQSQQMAAYQAERKNLESLETRYAEKSRQVEQLTLTSPASGEVIARGLSSAIGSYLAEGTLLLSIGNPRDKELRVSIAQEDMDAFKMYIGREIDVRLPYAGRFQSPLRKIDPQATVRLPHPALGAGCGGSLPVRPSAKESDDTEEDRSELLTPRFVARATIPARDCDRFFAGQTGYVRAAAYHRSIGTHIYASVARWVRRQLERGS